MANGKRGGNDIDWDAIRERYFQGATWNQLEEEFNVSRGAIHHHRKEEHWDKRKAERQIEIAKKIRNDHIRSTVKDMKEFNQICEEAVDQAVRITRNEVIREAKTADSGKPMNIKIIKDLIEVLREGLDIKRLINNIPSPKVMLEFDTLPEAPYAMIARMIADGNTIDIDAEFESIEPAHMNGNGVLHNDIIESENINDSDPETTETS